MYETEIDRRQRLLIGVLALLSHQRDRTDTDQEPLQMHDKGFVPVSQQPLVAAAHAR